MLPTPPVEIMPLNDRPEPAPTMEKPQIRAIHFADAPGPDGAPSFGRNIAALFTGTGTVESRKPGAPAQAATRSPSDESAYPAGIGHDGVAFHALNDAATSSASHGIAGVGESAKAALAAMQSPDVIERGGVKYMRAEAGPTPAGASVALQFVSTSKGEDKGKK
jgi:hypothetical protein